MLWPTINPDGQQMVAEWYMKNVGTPYELSGLPRLYQDYVGHDNNRDAYMLNMVESRVLEHTWRQWEPQIIYVHHQSGPFPTRIWLPPFSEPVGIDAPFIMSREVNMIGMAIAKGLEEHGQVGATHMGTAFDAWYPGLRRLRAELQEHRRVLDRDGAVPVRDAARLHARRLPAEHARPAAAEPLLEPVAARHLAAARRGRLHGDGVAVGARVRRRSTRTRCSSIAIRRDAIRSRSDKKKAPYAYFVPQQQRDPVAAVEMLRRLAFGGVRLSTLTAPVTIGARHLPRRHLGDPDRSGIRRDGARGARLQAYPDLRQYPGGPPERPYDAAGWSLPLQMGVRVVAAATPLDRRCAREDEADRRAARTEGEADDLRSGADRPTRRRSTACRASASTPSRRRPRSCPRPGSITGAGDVLVRRSGAEQRLQGDQSRVEAGRDRSGERRRRRARRSATPSAASRHRRRTISCKSLALQAERAALAPGRAVKQPRIGLYQPWTGSMDEGWTRWVLEQYGFTLIPVHPEDFKSPLADKIDVADHRRRCARAGGGRARRTRRARRRAGAVRPEYAYQLTPDDLQGFEQFVRGGGTRRLPEQRQHVRHPAAEAAGAATSSPACGREDFFLRGSIVQVTTDPTHPVMAGMPEKAAVFVDGSPVFETQDGFKGTVLARYQETGSPLLSGYLIGEEYLQGKAAALDVQLDAGHVVLLGFRPEWRGQPFGTFRVLFNSALFSR